MARITITKDDPFEATDFELAQKYCEANPEFVLCRVRHDVSLHRPPVDIVPHSDGGKTCIYICGGCGSEYHRTYMADGRYLRGDWKYAEGYRAKAGTGFGLTTRSGKAAFNLAMLDLMTAKVSPPKKSRTKKR